MRGDLASHRDCSDCWLDDRATLFVDRMNHCDFQRVGDRFGGDPQRWTIDLPDCSWDALHVRDLPHCHRDDPLKSHLDAADRCLDAVQTWTDSASVHPNPGVPRGACQHRSLVALRQIVACQGDRN